jgi:hypothetical protein
MRSAAPWCTIRTVEILIAAITVVVAGALIAWFVFTPHHPENGASHSDDHPETLSQRFYGRNPPGPAGPDAESQRPEDTGNAWDPVIAWQRRRTTRSRGPTVGASRASLAAGRGRRGTGQRADRDRHLRSPDFLDVERFPELRFRSSSVRPAGNRWEVSGELTIRGVTRPITLDVEFCGVAVDPWNNVRAGFLATTEINREDFDLTWNQALESGGFVVGKGVKIEADVEAIRQPDDAS